MADLYNLAEVQSPKNQQVGLLSPLRLENLIEKPRRTVEDRIDEIHKTINDPAKRTLAIMHLPSGKFL